MIEKKNAIALDGSGNATVIVDVSQDEPIARDTTHSVIDRAQPTNGSAAV